MMRGRELSAQDGQKQKRKMSAEQKAAYTVSTPDETVVVLCQLKSVYTGRNKATIENNLKNCQYVMNRTR